LARKVVREMASNSRAGYDVLPAATRAEALERAAVGPDLGLLDRNLPDGDGLDLARAPHLLFPGLPLVLMTGQAPRPGDCPELASEFVRVLAKPTNLDDLRHILATVLREKRMTEPTCDPAWAN
jgi:CheY-like chemotaxis protein